MMDQPHDADGATTGTGRTTPSLSDRVRSLRLTDEPANPVPGWRNRLPWVLCALFAAATLVLSIAVLRGSDQQPEKSAPVPGRTASSNGQPPASPAGTVVLESKGYIVPVHQIQVSPKVSGLVIELNIKEGMHVKEGTVLARLETVEYEAEVNRAKALLDSAWFRFVELFTGNRPDEIRQKKADLEEAIAQKEQLYKDWKRGLTLNRAALSAREFEQVESAYWAAERRVAALQSAYHLMLDGPRPERIQLGWAEVKQAQADLDRALWRLGNCTITAPVTGTILTKKAEKGNIVNPVAFNVAASLCDMADLTDLEIDLNIQERDIANVFEKQPCRIRPEAFPKREYRGFVSRLMPIADRAKGAIPVRVKVIVPPEEQQGQYLKPEMSVLVSFLAK
jgi:multidrug resistance efflux pump